jgi:anoctamin-10
LNYLFWASVLGREDLVKPLLDKQFSPFTCSYKGRNAVHAAAYNGHMNLIKIFFADKQNIKKLVNIMTIERP